MKRKSLTIGLVILIIIGIWIITYLFNNYMVNNNNTFNIYITKDSKKINDCEIILLNNIGYKIVKYNYKNKNYYSKIIFNNNKFDINEIKEYLNADENLYINKKCVVMTISELEVLRHYPVKVDYLTQEELEYYRNNVIKSD